MLQEEFGDHADALSMQYAVDGDSDVVKGAEQLMGDSYFGRHAYFMAQRHSAVGNPTFMYFFERRSPSPDETIGATHAFEIFPLFGTTLPLWPTDERDAATVQGNAILLDLALLKWATRIMTARPTWQSFSAAAAHRDGAGP